MTFIDLVTGDSCHKLKFFSVPTPFLSLGQKSHRKVEIAEAFRTWTSSCRWRKWWSRLTNCKLKQKNNLPFIACHVIYVISIHFICLSTGKISCCCSLLIMLICSSVARCLTQKHTPKHPPSAGRASVGWPYGMDHRRQNPWAHPQQNDTQTWPLNQPTNISKHALSSSFTRGMGDGNHASVTKSYSSSSCPKC